ncbi:MAG TPA: crosslink repair DNA glycosylase YcaQ family protein, partial [Kofleriaceae bacterium]|nr:crosslink repair DNA glycosylase YcaQ family protein [Kofleriaceae bacterium]
VRALAEQLGVIQIDSVNVLSRSHYLPAFSRLGPYAREALDALSWEPPRALFEYWAHEASLVPVELQPALRFRMAEAANEAWGRMRKMAKHRKAFVQDVLRVVAERGPLAAGEIELAEARKKKSKGGWWAWSDTKTAIELLFWGGQVTSTHRVAFERRYDLTERVLPAEVIAAPTPTIAESHRVLIERAARAIAIGTEADLRDYYRLAPAPSRAAIAELVEAGTLVAERVEGWEKPAYPHRAATEVPAIDPVRGALLSPFDNLIWTRDRTDRMFGMRFRLEIYVPKPKRVHGYYVLPFLLGDQLVARVDLKADRKSGTLLVHAAHAEPRVAKPAVAVALAAELRLLARFLGLAQVTAAKAGNLGAALARACGRAK